MSSFRAPSPPALTCSMMPLTTSSTSSVFEARLLLQKPSSISLHFASLGSAAPSDVFAMPGLRRPRHITDAPARASGRP